MIIDKLIEKINSTGNPTVVGLDPRLNYIPNHIKTESYNKNGKTPKSAGEILEVWGKKLIDSLYDIVPAIKPQIAMYEQYGSYGISAFINTVQYAKQKGMVVIGDIKRSDILSTAESYSDGHIGLVDIDGEKTEVFNEDFITVNPYLGSDSIEPFLYNCEKYDKGLFVLVKTSNAKSYEFQNIESDGKFFYETVAEYVNRWGENLRGKYGYSSIGAVVGATHKEEAEKLRKQFPNIFFLVPGYGAQGATPDDIKVCFDSDGLGAIVNSSRGIIGAYQNIEYSSIFTEEQFDAAARQAALDMKKAIGR